MRFLHSFKTNGILQMEILKNKWIRMYYYWLLIYSIKHLIPFKLDELLSCVKNNKCKTTKGTTYTHVILNIGFKNSTMFLIDGRMIIQTLQRNQWYINIIAGRIFIKNRKPMKNDYYVDMWWWRGMTKIYSSMKSLLIMDLTKYLTLRNYDWVDIPSI